MSSNDVKNYKQIKSDLDRLRLLVEKSELWVFKSKKETKSKDILRKKSSSGDVSRSDGKSENSQVTVTLWFLRP